MCLFWMTQMVMILNVSINNVASLENVALGKMATQIGSFYPYSTADKAVDGNKNQRMRSESCAHPNTSRNAYQPAWWRVDLGTSFDVYKVIIVNRNENTDRLSYTWVTVSEEENVAPNDDIICNEIIYGELLYVPVTCNYRGRNPPLRGRYVMIRRKENASERHLLNFCEVEVLSCPPGRWGYNLDNATDCSQVCNTCRDISETCRVSDGHCFTGCQDGFWGGKCDEQCDCPDGAPCNQTNGTCPSPTTTKTTTTTIESKLVLDRAVNTGLVVGIVVAFIVTVGIIVILFLYRRYKKQRQNRNTPPCMSREVPNPAVEMPPIPESTTDYEYIHEYEDLKQNKEEKRYENNEVVDKIYVSLRPIVMKTIRDHIKSNKDQQSRKQQISYQNVTLPEPIYDQVYVGRQQIPVALRDVKIYIKQVQEEIEKFKEEYEEEAEVLYTALIDKMQTAETAIPSSQFSSVYDRLQKINSDTLKSTLQEQYQVLELLIPYEERTLRSGLLMTNIQKNRKADIAPNDKYRPILRTPVEGSTDYINAVLVEGIDDENYILTQSPLKETVANLWKLVNDYNTSTIVMLNQIPTDQDGRFCPVVYWPTENGASKQFGTMIISNNISGVDRKNKNIFFRELSLSVEDSDYESPQNSIKQFSIKEWNQSTLIRDFIRLIELIEKWESETSSQMEPIVIHCLNGAERSGLFCVALYVAQQIKTQQKVDIFSAVKHIRLYRPQCVNSMEQYIFLHEFVQECIKHMD